jgi:hypothetical protein
MASKTLSVYDENPGSQPRRTAAVELRMSGQAQPSAIALLPPNPPSFYDGSRLRHLQTDLLGSEAPSRQPHLRPCFCPLRGRNSLHRCVRRRIIHDHFIIRL